MTTVAPDSIATNSFDHVALWVGDREPITELLCERLGMHVIERSDDFTLVGADAREGKVTLFDAPGPRDPGTLERIVLRVSDLDAALARLPEEIEVARDGGSASFEGPEGLGLGLVERHGLDYDLDGAVLRVSDPEQTASALAELGFERDGTQASPTSHASRSRAAHQVTVADRTLTLEPGGGGGEAQQPLLNHLALLVDDVKPVKLFAEQRGIEVEKVVDAENTIAVFLRGPEGILLEYVEHKPGFSLQ